MSQNIQQEAARIINEVAADLADSLAQCGETLDAQGLADCVSDRLHDISEEYRSMPTAQRRAVVLEVCRQYC